MELGHRRIGEVDISEAVGEFQRGLETVGEALFDPPLAIARMAHRDAIDHHFDVVLVFLVERRGVGDVVKLAVDADAGEAVPLPARQLLAILALAAAHDGGEEIGARPFGQRHHAIDHVGNLLRGDRQAGGGRIGDADARP